MTNSPTYRTFRNGAREVFKPTDYAAKIERTTSRERVMRDLCTCGNCGRTWDDGHVSGVTPTPVALCPFENA